jgi:bifunctional NMN adenylyltransferase/nudix hydrolase
MLQPTKGEVATVGVIVGRFQVPRLHDVHKDLIKIVSTAHPKTIVFLGLSPLLGTRNNPLDFECRKKMVLSDFPEVTVLYIKDCRSDDDWSRVLDKQISDIIGPNDTVLLYGGRDSFIRHYTGKFATQQLESDRYISGSEIRKEISKRTKESAEFRAGVIWSAYNHYPTAYCTIDAAIFDNDGERILLARKPAETAYRLVGGFSDPGSPSLEADVRREIMEEANIEVTDPVYVGSALIDDWRYRNEIDRIKTTLFACRYMMGSPRGGDDICEVRWFKLSDIKPGDVVLEHHKLLKMLAAKAGSVASNLSVHVETFMTAFKGLEARLEEGGKNA